MEKPYISTAIESNGTAAMNQLSNIGLDLLRTGLWASIDVPGGRLSRTLPNGFSVGGILIRGYADVLIVGESIDTPDGSEQFGLAPIRASDAQFQILMNGFRPALRACESNISLSLLCAASSIEIKIALKKVPNLRSAGGMHELMVGIHFRSLQSPWAQLLLCPDERVPLNIILSSDPDFISVYMGTLKWESLESEELK